MTDEISAADAVRQYKANVAASITHIESKNTSPAIILFKSGMFEHIAAEPIYVSSKKQLQHETRSRGLISDYAE